MKQPVKVITTSVNYEYDWVPISQMTRPFTIIIVKTKEYVRKRSRYILKSKGENANKFLVNSNNKQKETLKSIIIITPIINKFHSTNSKHICKSSFQITVG